jgi:hypothetical protein
MVMAEMTSSKPIFKALKVNPVRNISCDLTHNNKYAYMQENIWFRTVRIYGYICDIYRTWEKKGEKLNSLQTSA